MKNSGEKSLQPESLSMMLRELYVCVEQMGAKTLLPVGRDAPIIFKADYVELDAADPGDLFVRHRGRLLYAKMTAMDSTIMVEMPAESSIDEQPLRG